MAAYYNENDPYAAQWLRNLVRENLIAPGDVDERSIVDVRAGDLARYTQCHFFAGIGGWSLALRLAGWPDGRPVWTGSCPCQPFSAAGAGKAADDRRHLWPAWFSLIAQCSPSAIFGEQVEAAIGWGWLDLVCSDLEAEGYAIGAAVLPACSVSAPHIRQRLWFVADASGRDQWGYTREPRSETSAGKGQAWPANGNPARSASNTGELANSGCRGTWRDAGDGSGAEDQSESQREANWIDVGHASFSRRAVGDMAHAASGGQREFGDASWSGRGGHTDGSERADIMGNFASDGQRESRIDKTVGRRPGTIGGSSAWSDLEWIACTDGKARPTQPGLCALAHGIPRRTSKLRAYGNAIVPQAAAAFIEAFLDVASVAAE